MAAATVDELAERHESALHGREFGEVFERHLTKIEDHARNMKCCSAQSETGNT